MEGGASYGGTKDLDGTPRIVNNSVDMGAYEYLLRYNVTFGVESGNGTVTAQVNGSPLNSGSLVDSGTTVTFTATPTSGWKFVRWDINDTILTASSPEVTVDSDLTAVAYFERHSSSGSSGRIPITKYTLTIGIEGQGTTTPAAGTYSYNQGAIVNLEAQAQEGWEFEKWVISGTEVSDIETRVEMDNNITAKAYFAEKVSPPADQVVIILTIGSEVMLVDGQDVLMDVAPFIDPLASRTMVPIKFISEQLGADVKWQSETNRVRIVLGDQEILLTIGSTTALINGTATAIDIPAVIQDSRTFVPLRFISETLGAKVDWDGKTRQITVTKKPLQG
jgi:hypothetical protein